MNRFLMVCWLALMAFLVSACATPPPRPSQARISPEQKIILRVLDSRDRPVAGAKVILTAQAGRPLEDSVFITNAQGRIETRWTPQAVDHTEGTQISDRLTSYLSKISYRVEAKGYAGAEGVMQGRSLTRKVATPELKSLDRQARLKDLVAVVVLRHTRDLLSGELSLLPLQHPLVVRCLAFRQDMLKVVPKLGAEFAWPTFKLNQGHLQLLLDWRGITWGGLKPAPHKAQVAVNSGLPLALACGDSLVPLPGVTALSLVFLSEIKKPNDPHAAPQQAAVIISAPPAEYEKLARGGITPDAFLEKHPPALRRD